MGGKNTKNGSPIHNEGFVCKNIMGKENEGVRGRRLDEVCESGEGVDDDVFSLIFGPSPLEINVDIESVYDSNIDIDKIVITL